MKYHAVASVEEFKKLSETCMYHASHPTGNMKTVKENQ
jgi:hypothetical protein